MAFGEQSEGGGEGDGGDRGKEGEDPSPAEAGDQQAADGGGEQRRETDNEEEEREDAGALFDRKEVAHHGDGCDLCDTAAERGEEAQCDEDVQGRRESAADGADDIGEQTDVERPFAAEAVKEWAVEELTKGETEKVGGEREGDGGGGGVEFRSDGGECRQVHVDGEGGDDTERSEEQNDPCFVANVARHPGGLLLDRDGKSRLLICEIDFLRKTQVLLAKAC